MFWRFFWSTLVYCVLCLVGIFAGFVAPVGLLIPYSALFPGPADMQSDIGKLHDAFEKVMLSVSDTSEIPTTCAYAVCRKFAHHNLTDMKVRPF